MIETKQRDQGRGTRVRRYPSDLTASEWQIIATFLAQRAGPGAPRMVETRAIVDAIFYRLRTGCA